MQTIKVGIEFTLIAPNDENYSQTVSMLKEALHDAIRNVQSPSLNWINNRCTGMSQIKGIKLSGGFDT